MGNRLKKRKRRADGTYTCTACCDKCSHFSDSNVTYYDEDLTDNDTIFCDPTNINCSCTGLECFLCHCKCPEVIFGPEDCSEPYDFICSIASYPRDRYLTCFRKAACPPTTAPTTTPPGTPPETTTPEPTTTPPPPPTPPPTTIDPPAGCEIPCKNAGGVLNNDECPAGWEARHFMLGMGYV